MAIDINKLRQMNLFGGGEEVGSNRGMYDHLFEPPPLDTINVPPVDTDNSIEDLLKAYPQETGASERFKQLLENYPDREPASFGRKITSMLTGLSTLGTPANNGIEMQGKILQEPNERKIADWSKQIQPAEVAATQENTRNINSRNLAALEIKNRKDERAQDEKERANKAKEASTDMRNRAYAAKANGFVVKQEGDRMMATNPITLQRVDLGPSGMMDEIDKITLQGNFAQNRADTMAAGQATRAQLAADTSTANTVAAGAQTQVDSKTGLPVVINPRAATPTQTPVEGGTPIQRIPGTKGPSQGQDLARVRGMSAEALKLIKESFLVMPKDPTQGSPTLNPKVGVGVGWKNWDPAQLAPESPQRSAIAVQKRLKDLLTLSLIGEMKEQSKTGATGFGQLTGRELDVLESAASTLDWAKAPQDIVDELTRIMEKLEKIMQPGEGEFNVSTTSLAPKYRQSRITGAREVSTDGGKTWKPFVGK